VFHSLHNFCAVDMSAFYLDILKDRLYTTGTTSVERRSGQTTMHAIPLDHGPPHGASAVIHRGRGLELHEEGQGARSVFFADFPKAAGKDIDETLDARGTNSLRCAARSRRRLEALRRDKKIGIRLTRA